MDKYIEALKLEGKNFKEALPLLEQASKEGDYRASYRLAQLYNQGSRVNRDVEIASQYFDEAFKQINNSTPTSESNCLLGTIYLFGLGTVAKDEFKAVEYFTKASENNDVNAIVLLANCYRNGVGCDKDDEKAFELISKIKDSGHPSAYKVYADCLFFGNGVEANPKKAFEYYQKASKAGEVSAIFMLGTLYHEGKGVPVDNKKALEYFLKAAEFNLPDALKNVAYFYQNGIGVEKDFLKEAEFMKKYADTGSAEGLFLYGNLCLDGNRKLYRYAEGIEYLKRAVQLKEPRATHMVGRIYETGLYGTFTNEKVAFNHYLVSYNLGFKPAAYDVLRCYKRGIGTVSNPQQIEQFEKIVEELDKAKNNQA